MDAADAAAAVAISEAAAADTLVEVKNFDECCHFQMNSLPFALFTP